MTSFELVKATEINHIYRETALSGQYDMLIISLVHQDIEMIKYIANNLNRFIKGSFVLIVHANGQSINENDLPPWCWLARDTIKTIHTTPSLLHALTSCIKTAFQTIDFINCMYVSSGSVFFREFVVPTQPAVHASSHEDIFFPETKFTYTMPIPIDYLGKCAEYLLENGGVNYGGWQYKHYSPSGMDIDTDIQEIIKKRPEIKFIKGSHLPGMVFPQEVCKMLLEDVNKYFSKAIIRKYALEEILPSTYSYYYALQHGLPIKRNVVYYNWLHQYIMTDINFIEHLPTICPEAYAVVKVPYDLKNPIREHYKGVTTSL
jgi:hypothetical protein